jgi:hypothetical protein
MSVKVMARVWAHSKCSGTELVTVLALADWADDDGWCWPSLPKLAIKTRVTVSQLCKILTAIEQQTGEVYRERSTGGRNRRTRYRVVVTENSVIDNTVTDNTVVENSVIRAQKTVSQARGALIRHRSVNMRSTKAQRPTNPEVKEFIDWFAGQYRTLRGEPYHINWGKDGTLVKDLLRTFDLQDLKRRALRMLESDDPWVSGTDRGIGILASQPNKFTARTIQSRPQLQEMPQ